MAEDGRSELKRYASQLLDGLVKMIEQGHGDKPITLRQLLEASEKLEKSPRFETLTETTLRRLSELGSAIFTNQRRVDPFRRLISYPLDDLFAKDMLSRDIMPAYFNFIHLVMGDETAILTQLCQKLAGDGSKSDDYDWKKFFASADARLVLWEVLRRIADSFRRFAIRRDWLINLMQNKPQAVSIAPNAFIPKAPGEVSHEVHPFGGREFDMMFRALFDPMRRLTPHEQQDFARAYKQTPQQAFGDIWKHLDEPAK